MIMKTVEDERKYRREYMCKYRLRPDVKKKIQKYRKKRYNSTNYKKKLEEYHNSEGYQFLREREKYKRQRDMYMVTVSVLSNKIQYEKRMNVHRRRLLRLKKIESMQERLSKLMLQIDECDKSIEISRCYKTRDDE